MYFSFESRLKSKMPFCVVSDQERSWQIIISHSTIGGRAKACPLPHKVPEFASDIEDFELMSAGLVSSLLM